MDALRLDSELELSTTRYLPGGAVDVVRPRQNELKGVALVWHGRTPSGRLELRGFAVALARRGIAVVVPDYSPIDEEDGAGRLHTSVGWSLEYAANADLSTPLHLIGWSYGARAAIGHVLSNPGGAVRRAIGLGGSYGATTPTADRSPLDLATSRSDAAILLVHGRADPIHPPAASEQLHHALLMAGTASELRLVDTDHAGVVVATYNSSLGFCTPPQAPTAPMDETVEAVAGFILEESSC